jgi:ornithine cyclodeaminase
MRFFNAAAVEAALPDLAMVERLARAFAEGGEVPLRHHHKIAVPGAPDATLLLMPAWRPGGALGIKSVTVFPGNAARGIDSVLGVYLLLDGTTGQPRALLDGRMLTLRRTAGTSALVARHLARRDARRLAVVGAGALAGHLARAHATLSPIETIAIWNRSPGRGEALAEALRRRGLKAQASGDLERTVAEADIVTCATLSQDPLIRGAWLKPGAHVDLVGGFTPSMREADDEAIRRASVYVDTREGATKEAGDIVIPLANGVLRRDEIKGDIAELCRGTASGRRSPDEITLFKSVGYALEDLAAAELVLERAP